MVVACDAEKTLMLVANGRKSSGLKALVKALTKGSSGGNTQKVSGQKWQSGKVLKSLDNVDKYGPAMCK
jgi:hypothetical protein